jgi:hypothetical protein
MEAYWNILGIGPWAVTEFGQPTNPDMTYYGKRVWGRCRQAMVPLGPIELELLEPLEGVSIYHDWLAEHGESFHHMKFLVEGLDIDKVERNMLQSGLPVIQGGHFGPNLMYKYGYFDTLKPLKAVWVSSNRTGGVPKGASFYPQDPRAESPAKMKISHIKQIGLVVRDAARTAENYRQIMGIGPWEIQDWTNEVLWDRTYHNQPTWSRERVAHASVGELELELIQPIEGDSIFQDWLSEHGEGVHHVKFPCDDVDTASRALSDMGFENIQSGRFIGPREKRGGFNYFDIPPLHCICELAHEPQSF